MQRRHRVADIVEHVGVAFPHPLVIKELPHRGVACYDISGLAIYAARGLRSGTAEITAVAGNFF